MEKHFNSPTLMVHKKKYKLNYIPPHQKKWHNFVLLNGFKHAENSKVSLVYREDGTPEFLAFLDNVTIKRINKPLGEKINGI